jgi:hypothetical protein
MGSPSPESIILDKIRQGILELDPVAFCENNLTLDGEDFRLTGNGYKPFADIYRYIGIKALEPNSKPVVFVKGRQVGGTTMAAALELFFMASTMFGTNGRPPMRIMHCFPLLDLGYMYTKTKLNVMIKTAKLSPNSTVNKVQSVVEERVDRSAAANDSLQFKQFQNGNHLFIESTGFDGSRLRGFTADGVFFDEVQLIPETALGNVNKILSQSKYGKIGDGIQVYYGTPLAKGSGFHRMWMKSSMQYYYLGCENCGEYFPLYTPESSEWESIWIEDDIPHDYRDPKTGLFPHGFIVKCIHCGHEQDKRPAAERGKWVSSNPDEDAKFVGYHLNQLYMPNFNRDKIIGEKPENNPINSERHYQNEVLGEFYTGDASPITADQIHQYCADMGRKFRRGVPIEENKRVYLGCDWGEKVDPDQVTGGQTKRTQGQSYSSVVVLSVEGPELLSIEYAALLKKNDPEYKEAVIDQIFRNYSVCLAVGDIGHAGDLTKKLQREYGDAFLASRAHGSIKNHVKFVEDVFPKEIQFEKNYYIEELFNLMKAGNIRFPYGSYEQIGWLVQHCSSMEMKATTDRSGNINIQYVKGATPNDGLMALLNAYIAYKYETTEGFRIVHPDRMNTDPGRGSPIPAIVGYLPFMNPLKRNK